MDGQGGRQASVSICDRVGVHTSVNRLAYLKAEGACRRGKRGVGLLIDGRATIAQVWWLRIHCRASWWDGVHSTTKSSSECTHIWPASADGLMARVGVRDAELYGHDTAHRIDGCRLTAEFTAEMRVHRGFNLDVFRCCCLPAPQAL